MTTFASVTLTLLNGFGQTCKLFILTLVCALPLGLLVSFGSMSRFAPFSWINPGKNGFLRWLKYFCPISFIVRIFVWVIRGTPLMLQLFVIFYAPGLIWGPQAATFGRFGAALIAFVINYACYFSEIYRGGIQGIPRGQQEAGQVLGMTKLQIFFQITLMQVVKRILPPISNEIITLVKDTSLARVIGFMEIIFYGQKYMTTSALVWPMMYTAVFYLIFVGVLTLLFNAAEKKLRYFAV